MFPIYIYMNFIFCVKYEDRSKIGFVIFHADFNEIPFISIALRVVETLQ